MQKTCNDCKVEFNPSREGIVAKVDGKEINYCGPCCRKES